MQHAIRSLFRWKRSQTLRPSRLVLALAAALVLSACGDQADESENLNQLIDSSYTPTLFITFESGPNVGRHQYIVDATHGSLIELKYNSVNDVSLLNLRDLISLDGTLRLAELQRFNKGKLAEGANNASTWRAEPSDQNKQCGVLNLTDPENEYSYNNGFGKFSDCGVTMVDSISAWKNSEDSVTKMRITKGGFSDRVKFQMSMDNEPFKRFETAVTVEFDLLETTARF